MGLDAHALLRSLCLADAMSKNDVSKQQFCSGNICAAQIAFISHRE